MPLDDFLSRALDLASVQGASYCDVRLVETNQERFVVRSGAVETLSNDESQGIGAVSYTHLTLPTILLV